MPEEIEVPTEQLHEAMEEAAEESSFNSKAALSSALIAVFAAICALLAGGRANEAVIQQIKASDTWGFYQAKSIKSAQLTSKTEILKALGKKVDDKGCGQRLDEYKKDMDELNKEASRPRQRSPRPLRRPRKTGRRSHPLPDRHRHVRHRRPQPQEAALGGRDLAGIGRDWRSWSMGLIPDVPHDLPRIRRHPRSPWPAAPRHTWRWNPVYEIGEIALSGEWRMGGQGPALREREGRGFPAGDEFERDQEAPGAGPRDEP